MSMKECYKCGELLDSDNEPFVKLPKYFGTEFIWLCIPCVKDLAEQFKTCAKLAEEMKNRQWK